MRVLIASDYGTPTGGEERMSALLRDGLRARGHDVRVLTSSARPSAGAIDADYRAWGTTSRLRGLAQTCNPLAARALRRALAGFAPDLVHVRMFLTQLSPLILPVLRGRPSLLHVETYRVICPTGSKLLPDGSSCTRPAGRVCRQAGCLPPHEWLLLSGQMALWRRWRGVFDRIVCNSEWVRERLGAEGVAAHDVVPNGVPVTPRRPPLREPPILVFAGRLVREKGVAVLLRAAAQLARELPELRLLLAGDGPLRGELARQAAQPPLAGRVRMLGHLDPGALERALAPGWVQAVPSLWEEPFGLVAVEAMMRGQAVVTSRSGGLGALVEEGVSGFRVAPGDADALAAALRPLLSDRARAERMGAAARRRARAHFSADRYVEAMLAVYARVLSGRARGGSAQGAGG